MKRAILMATLVCVCGMPSLVNAESIDLGKIKSIESSGNAFAYNRVSQAIGLYQITPICLKEWNNYHASEQYYSQDLYNPKVNTKIAKWYLERRIPQMLRYYKKEVSISNILISYNAGINYVVKDLPLPKETKEYLVKYERR